MEKQKASSFFWRRLGGSNDQYYDWWYFHSILTPTVYQNQSTYIPDFSVEVKKYPNFLTLTLDLVGWGSEGF